MTADREQRPPKAGKLAATEIQPGCLM